MALEPEVLASENSSTWNGRLEEAAQQIGHTAQGYKLMHVYQAQWASQLNKILTTAGIVCGPLAGVLSGIQAFLHPEEDPTIPIVASIVGCLAGIIAAAVKFGKYDESSTANKSAAARYTSIESNIRRQLSLYRNDRVPAASYMEWIETKYEELLMSAPLLPAWAYSRHKELAERSNLPVPEQYNSIISINEEYEESKVEEIRCASDIRINAPDFRGDRQVRRSDTMSQLPELNLYSDKRLEYEMRRMIGIS